MLDVHPPHHAVSTWRDFFIHIATIVVGLLIAVGLEQTVEYIHHRREVAETRRLLREEREQNRKNFAANAASYRWQVVMLQNDLLVLEALRQHPGIAEQDLPGILYYSAGDEEVDNNAWKIASVNAVTQYMGREEVASLDHLYRLLETADADLMDLWRAMNRAHQYAFDDPNPTHLTAAQIAEEVRLTEDCAEINFRWGITLENIQQAYPDFDSGPSRAELFNDSRYIRSATDTTRIAPAQARTDRRFADVRKHWEDLAEIAEKK